MAELEGENKTPQPPTILKKGKIKGGGGETIFVIKSPILVSNYNVYYQILNTVSIYITLTRKD